jgi:AcrR family transcriptional regulator
MDIFERSLIQRYILEMESVGLVSRTFRRLDPERQETVINAILSEATEKGPTKVNIKQVAERAGVSVGSLYTYFPNREGMLEFTIELVTRFALDEFTKFRPYLTALPFREALEAYLLGGVEWSQMYTGFLKLFARAAYQGDPELAERLVKPIANSLREIIHDMLAQAIARGEIREDIDLEASTRLIHALTIAVGDSQLLPYLNNYFQVNAEDIPADQVMEALFDLIMKGIGY